MWIVLKRNVRHIHYNWDHKWLPSINVIKSIIQMLHKIHSAEKRFCSVHVDCKQIESSFDTHIQPYTHTHAIFHILCSLLLNCVIVHLNHISSLLSFISSVCVRVCRSHVHLLFRTNKFLYMRASLCMCKICYGKILAFAIIWCCRWNWKTPLDCQSNDCV